jgi:hypothetical protein
MNICALNINIYVLNKDDFTVNIFIFDVYIYSANIYFNGCTFTVYVFSYLMDVHLQ